MTDTLTYEPPASVAGFLTDDAFISLILGPIGSTKTTAGIMKIAYQAAKMAPCRDGIRRSKAVWVRNTREQLRDTSIPDFLNWFPDGMAGDYAKTDYKFTLRFADVECEVLFRGLDDQNDVRRLLSLQASFAILDEFREINSAIFETIQGRLGRYPNKMMNGVGCKTDDGQENKHLWGMSNPPDMDTYWEKFLSEPPKNAHCFFQPSGLSPDADWVQYLPDDYYANLAEGKTDDWIDVYIHAKFGKTLAGRPVFRNFKSDYHVAKSALRPLKTMNRPLIVGMDFGLNPSCTINQMDAQARFLTFDALTSDGIGLTEFITKRLRPLLSSEKYAGIPILVVGDPAGWTRVQTDARSCADILLTMGFKAIPARTNNIVARLAAVDGFLARQIEGGPAHLIDPAAVPLIRAMRGGYRYKLKKTGDHEDTPEKNEHSHVADAHEYACLHAEASNGANFNSVQRREVKKVRSGGWT